MNTSAIVLAWPMLSIIVDKKLCPEHHYGCRLIVIRTCAVAGDYFALEKHYHGRNVRPQNRFTRMAISKGIGGLIASGFGPIPGGYFLHPRRNPRYPIAIK